MPESTAEVGIIGLGVMGSNYARNLAHKGIKTAVYNRTAEVTEQFLKEYKSEQIIGSTSLEELIEKLDRPRKIIILVKAGAAVDAVIASLTPLLDKDDMIIDFGNSHFDDTERRGKDLESYGIKYWGCGISGGERGALHGPSLMPGGPKESWPELKPILEASAAKDFSGKPCVTYLGHGSAGNYVKMVHNGIEYGMMQMMAEAYEIMKTLLNMPAPAIGQIFKQYDRGKLSGFLFELATTVLKKEDEAAGNGYLIDKIQDKAAQKGTGSWTSIDGLEKGVATPTITEAVISRIISSKKELRQNLSKIYPSSQELENLDTDKFIDLLEDALYAGIICAFAQGMELIKTASEENEWHTDLSEVVRIWQGGCIIRTIVLSTFEKELVKGPQDIHLLETAGVSSLIKGNLQGLRTVVEIATRNAIPTHGLSSALHYFDGMRQPRGNANFIQALRDGFGAHTYERTDQEGSFHTEWKTT